jgi:hypothetical protein
MLGGTGRLSGLQNLRQKMMGKQPRDHYRAVLPHHWQKSASTTSAHPIPVRIPARERSPITSGNETRFLSLNSILDSPTVLNLRPCGHRIPLPRTALLSKLALVLHTTLTWRLLLAVLNIKEIVWLRTLARSLSISDKIEHPQLYFLNLELLRHCCVPQPFPTR